MIACKALLIGTVAAVIAIPSRARDKDPREGEFAVDIRMFNTAKVSRTLLEHAEWQASRIFRAAGIVLGWTAGSTQETEPYSEDRQAPAPGASVPLICDANAGVCQFNVRLEARAPAGLSPTELAAALPFARFGTRSTIYYDRVQIASGGSGAECSVILGHVLAHEIGHVLLGTRQHSRIGLMQMPWGRADFERMQSSLLLFGPGEVRLMQERLKTRQRDHEWAQIASMGS